MSRMGVTYRNARTHLESLCLKHQCDPEELLELYNFYGKYEKEIQKMIHEGTTT